jgi:hypothetical protein
VRAVREKQPEKSPACHTHSLNKSPGFSPAANRVYVHGPTLQNSTCLLLPNANDPYSLKHLWDGYDSMNEIEAGFLTILQKIEDLKGKEAQLAEQIGKNDAALLERMAQSAIPVIQSIGIVMLQKGKQDTKGEMYDPKYYPKKMLLLGKTDPSQYRPDDAAKKVTDQYCVLSEEGKFFELMYSSDGFVTDSYLNPLDTGSVLESYGYDAMYMLYQALHDYLKGEEELLDALEKTISYVFLEKR